MKLCPNWKWNRFPHTNEASAQKRGRKRKRVRRGSGRKRKRRVWTRKSRVPRLLLLRLGFWPGRRGAGSEKGHFLFFSVWGKEKEEAEKNWTLRTLSLQFEEKLRRLYSSYVQKKAFLIPPFFRCVIFAKLEVPLVLGRFLFRWWRIFTTSISFPPPLRTIQSVSFRPPSRCVS